MIASSWSLHLPTCALTYKFVWVYVCTGLSPAELLVKSKVPSLFKTRAPCCGRTKRVGSDREASSTVLRFGRSRTKRVMHAYVKRKALICWSFTLFTMPCRHLGAKRSLHWFHGSVGQIDSKSLLACYAVSAELVIWRESGGVCALGNFSSWCLLLRTIIDGWVETCHEK